jgi:hypothetical protein
MRCQFILCHREKSKETQEAESESWLNKSCKGTRWDGSPYIVLPNTYVDVSPISMPTREDIS